MNTARTTDNYVSLIFALLSFCMLYLSTEFCSLGTAWQCQQQVLFSFSMNVPDWTWFTCFLSDSMGCMAHSCFSKLAVIQWNSSIFILSIRDLGRIRVFSQWIRMKLARASAFPSCFCACNYHYLQRLSQILPKKIWQDLALLCPISLYKEANWIQWMWSHMFPLTTHMQ